MNFQRAVGVSVNEEDIKNEGFPKRKSAIVRNAEKEL
jgi:hypothetical protein